MKMNVDAVRSSVARLRDALQKSALDLETAGASEARQKREEMLGHIEDYLLPRLEHMEAPLLVVVGGSTGAGKSTLVNSLVGALISPAGVLRPTTTTPLVVANPADLHWFEGRRILPDLARVTGAPRTGDDGLHLVGDDDIPVGMALLDAPDIDSVVATNRLLAAQLLAAADLWLFVTTAARYADGVPWEFLREAQRRSASLSLVLNRIPTEALEEVPLHLEQMLADEGLLGTPVLTIPEVHLDDGLIPDAQLHPLRLWLNDLAADADRRKELIAQTLQGSLNALPARGEEIARSLRDQMGAAEALAMEAAQAYSRALQDVEGGLNAGTLLRGEVLARWHEFIGTGDFMRSVQGAIGRVRDRIGDVLLGRPPVEAEVRSEVASRVETVVVAACDKALETTIDAWRARREGREMIEDDRVPRRSSTDLRDRIDAAVRAWQRRVLELVTEQGQDKRAVGRALSLGINGTGAALMVAVFANTGGLTGAEVAVAGGTAAVSQRVLEAVFGDQAVRTLTADARTDLMQRLADVLRDEARRFEEPARDAMPAAEDVEDLEGAITSLAQAGS